jgi:uracil-DNA glycosylase
MDPATSPEPASSAVRLDESWRTPLAGEFAQPYMQALKDFLVAEKAAGKQIYPKGAEYFRALDLTPLDKVRVVILGQDPYHGPGQAHGLCFSVRPGVPPPPSLVNIYKEMHADLGIARARHGFLEHWARQGVLLLNSVLTVENGRAASHRERGWEKFTDAVIRLVAARPDPVVFILWRAAPRAQGTAPVAALGPCRLLRQQAFFADQRLFGGPRVRADRLAIARALSRAAPGKIC